MSTIPVKLVVYAQTPNRNDGHHTKIQEWPKVWLWGIPNKGDVILINVFRDNDGTHLGGPGVEGGEVQAQIVTGIVHITDSVPPVELEVHALWKTVEEVGLKDHGH